MCTHATNQFAPSMQISGNAIVYTTVTQLIALLPPASATVGHQIPEKAVLHSCLFLGWLVLGRFLISAHK
jgi:hypothetical protein